jgi:cysteine synthase A
MGNIYCKCECFNPTGSVKDRVMLSMIEEAMDEGQLENGSSVVMASSGLSAVSLAAIGAAKGLHVIITATESINPLIAERVRSFGAQLQTVSDSGGMKSAVAHAESIAAKQKGAVFFNQFENPACVNAHRDYTGVEIWQDMDGDVDIFVAGVGTGAAITGIAQLLRSKKPSVKIIAVEPSESAVLQGKNAGLHDIPGLGAGFIPPLYDKTLVDEIIDVSSESAKKMSLMLTKTYAVPVSTSSGAVYLAAQALGERREYAGKNIVALLPA